jgi:hypothetical protein
MAVMAAGAAHQRLQVRTLSRSLSANLMAVMAAGAAHQRLQGHCRRRGVAPAVRLLRVLRLVRAYGQRVPRHRRRLQPRRLRKRAAAWEGVPGCVRHRPHHPVAQRRRAVRLLAGAHCSSQCNARVPSATAVIEFPTFS